jgi:hypothetical protein
MTALFPEMGQRPKIISPQRSNGEPPATGPTAEEQGATARAIIMRVQFCHPGNRRERLSFLKLGENVQIFHASKIVNEPLSTT